MKKRTNRLTILLSLIAISAMLFSLASCGKKGKYAEIPSSKEEATVVAVVGGHDVKYELFRAYFSAMYSGATEGMTEEGWEAAKTAVMREIAGLYATFDVASENGVDPYGDAIDEAVDELIAIQYEGGEVNGALVPAHTRKEYKEALAAANLTDAVMRLIYRYDATQAALYDYLVTNYGYGENPGAVGDPRAFFDSDDCAHGVWLFISDGQLLGREAGLARAAEAREELAGAADYAAVQAVLRKYASPTSLSKSDIEYGFYVSRNQGNTPVQRALISDFFTLAPYTCGEIREDADGVWFAVGLPKNAADYDRDPEAIFQLMYAEEKVNRPIAEKTETYLSGASYSSAFPTFSAGTLDKLTVK